MTTRDLLFYLFPALRSRFSRAIERNLVDYTSIHSNALKSEARRETRRLAEKGARSRWHNFVGSIRHKHLPQSDEVAEVEASTDIALHDSPVATSTVSRTESISAPIVTGADITATAVEPNNPHDESNPLPPGKASSHRGSQETQHTARVSTSSSRNSSRHSRKRQYGFGNQLKHVLLGSWANVVLLPFVPAGFVVRYTNQNPIVTFAVNFLAVLPLAIMLGTIADELVLRTGDLLGSIINSTFNNAVQLITSILLLKDRQIAILQTTLIGSILSNMHLALGLGFFMGGISRNRQHYNVTAGQTIGMGMILAVSALILPTAAAVLESSPNVDDRQASDRLIAISRAIAIVLLLCYGAYLFFSLYTHTDMYAAPSEKVAKRDTFMKTALIKVDETEEEDKEPKITSLVAIIGIISFTTLLGFNTAFATDSLDGLIEHTGLSPSFIGVTILPLLNVDFMMFPLAINDKMDLFLAVTAGKSLQTALLVIPMIVLLGWAMGVPFGLNFDPFEVVALFASTLYVNNMIADGQSHWLNGVLLLALFVIICTVSYYVPS